MKTKLLLSATLISLVTTFNTAVFAQSTNNVNIVAQAEAEKVKNIQKLLEITGTKNLSQQVMSQMLATMKPQYPQVPPKFWDALMAEIKPDEMINKLIPIYSKHFTNQEIKEMITFYQTPLGKKTIQVMPQIMQESMQVGQNYGISAAKRAIQKLEAEGYLRRQ